MSEYRPNPVAASFGFDRSLPPVTETVARVARRLWPIKTARNLAARTRRTHRAAEDWLTCRTGMSADALADLLRSDAGLEVLEALMGEVKPSWWPAFRDDCRTGAIVARLEEIRREVEEARRAVA